MAGPATAPLHKQPGVEAKDHAYLFYTHFKTLPFMFGGPKEDTELEGLRKDSSFLLGGQPRVDTASPWRQG